MPNHHSIAAAFLTLIAAASATRAADTASAPIEPTWASIKSHYTTPQWFTDGKFGIFMHWGIYFVPAHGSEWYVRYIYGGNAAMAAWHIQNFGPLDKFGYKDFISMFTAAKWDPDAWAELFRKAGAINKYNAKNMGPKRDLIGDLGKAVRAKGLKFGMSNHSANHFDFIPINPESDQKDPEWAPFYSVDRSPEARKQFQETWVQKNFELIDKYHPAMLWFDGIGGGATDAMKLQVAAHMFITPNGWHNDVTLSGKGSDFPAGATMDYERQGRIYPRGIKTFAWQVDDPIGNKFAYVKEIQYKPAALLIHRLIDCVSMNGNYLMNISPMADGTIPQEQQDRLLAMGKWLDVNGEAIYATHAWTHYGEGPYYDSPPPAWRAPGPDDPPNETYTSKEIRFTIKADTLYAIVMGWPGETAIVTSLATGKELQGKIEKVELLGHQGTLQFTRDAEGLKVQMPADKPCDFAYALKISGLKLN